MGLAPFFDRAREGVAQVLRNFDADAFERRLGEVVVTIAFDTRAATTAEGLAALDMAARLAARLYPRVCVRALDGDRALADELIALMRAINPAIEIANSADDEITLVAGATAVDGDHVVHFGSDRWIARVSSSGPVGFGDSLNPFGAGAAACLAAANVFRIAFARWVEKPDPDEDVGLSLLDFQVGRQAANGDLPVDLDIGRVQLVGVGAIGNAFVWALSRMRGVSGDLDLVDHEAVELTNLQRYVLALMADVDTSKVELAAAALARCGIRPNPVPSTWSEHAAASGNHRFEAVAVALDNARDRMIVQGALPRRILNAWTQAGDLGVSRHGFGGDEACLACLYLPTGSRRSEDEIVAEELGMPERVLEVRAMLHLGMPVGEPMVREIAGRLGIGAATLMPFAGLPLRAFRQKAVCGNAIMRAADGGGADIQVPMAFQSALAGVMLAAETVAHVGGLRNVEPATRSVVDLMRPLPPRITFPLRKGSAGAAKCICQDTDHLAVHREKWG